MRWCLLLLDRLSNQRNAKPMFSQILTDWHGVNCNSALKVSFKFDSMTKNIRYWGVKVKKSLVSRFTTFNFLQKILLTRLLPLARSAPPQLRVLQGPIHTARVVAKCGEGESPWWKVDKVEPGSPNKKKNLRRSRPNSPHFVPTLPIAPEIS